MGKVVEMATNENLIAIQRKYAYTLLVNDDLEGCINTCDYLLRLPPKDEKSRKEIRSFCLTNQATCLKKMGRYEEALEKANEATKDCSKDDYYKAIFTKSLIHKKIGDKDSALKELNSCIKWYKHNNMYYELAKCLDVKADLLKSEELFLAAIENYKLAEKEENYLDKDKFKKEFDNVYQRLVELYLYIGEQNMIKSYQALNHIHNIDIKEETKDMIKNLYGKEA